MTHRIYKYAGPSNLDRILVSPDTVALRCSYPKDFNDPYELFLTIDFDEKPEELAFYADAIGQIPQLPTTCFSLSPIVVPMWAHYAQNHEGFAIEFNEEKLVELFPQSGFGTVDYRDAANPGLKDMLYRASIIGKPRYVYLLQKGVFSAAYYTKTTCWSYEQERRMVIHESETRRVGEMVLMDVPKDCVTALISGSRASDETIAKLRERAEELGCNYFQQRVGRTTALPYFIDSIEDPYVFDGGEIRPSSQYCGACKEPIPSATDECSWCQIDESHRNAAASRNPYRMMAHYGMLESYMEDMNSIGRDGSKK